MKELSNADTLSQYLTSQYVDNEKYHSSWFNHVQIKDWWKNESHDYKVF